MEYYQRGVNTDEYLEVDIPGVNTSNADLLLVTQSTKPNLIISSALTNLKENHSILWIGIGSSIDKAILCANITKNRLKISHEVNHISYKRIVEYWEPVLDGLDKLQVTRSIPAMFIMQSLVPFTVLKSLG